MAFQVIISFEIPHNYLFDKRSTGPDNMIAGFGPHNFPNLIICGEYSMFKNNAMPL